MPPLNNPPTQAGPLKGLARLEAALANNATRQRRVMTVVVMRLDDLPELHATFGGELYQAATAVINRKLERLVRARGVGARTGPTEFTLAFPDLYQREALALISMTLGGRPPRFEFSLDGTDLILVPEIAAAMIEPNESIRETHGRLRTQLMSLMESERIRLDSMTKNRERQAGRAAPAIGRDKNLDCMGVPSA